MMLTGKHETLGEACPSVTVFHTKLTTTGQVSAIKRWPWHGSKITPHKRCPFVVREELKAQMNCHRKRR
jgi:hypothetical protein